MSWSNSTPEKRSFCFLKPLSDRNTRSPSPCQPSNPFKFIAKNISKRDISAYLRIEKSAFENNLKALREQHFMLPVDTNFALEKRARKSCEDILENHPIRIKRKSWFRSFNISNSNVPSSDIDNISNMIQGRESAPADNNNNNNSISQRMIVGGSISLKKPGSRRPLSTCDQDLNGNNNQIDESPTRNTNYQRKATKSIGISGNNNNSNNTIINNNNSNQNQNSTNNPRTLSQLSSDISPQQQIILVTGSSKKQANTKLATFGEENNTGLQHKEQLKHMQNQFNAHKFLHSASPVCLSDVQGRQTQLQRVRHQSIKHQQFKEQYIEYQQQMHQQMLEKKQQQWQKRSRVISDDALGVLKKNTNNFQLIPYQQSVVPVSKQIQLSAVNYSQLLSAGNQQSTPIQGVSESQRISNTEQAQPQIGQLCSSPGKQLQSEQRAAQQELKQSSKQPLRTQLLSKRFSNLESLVVEKSQQLPREQQEDRIEQYVQQQQQQPQQQQQYQKPQSNCKQQFAVDLQQVTDTNLVDSSSSSPSPTSSLKQKTTNQFSSFLLQAREEQIKHSNGKQQLDCYSPLQQQSPLKQSRIRFQKSSENNIIRVAQVVEQSTNNLKDDGFVKDNNYQSSLPSINALKISSNCSQEENTEELTEHDRSYLLPILDIQEQEYLQETSCRFDKEEELDQSPSYASSSQQCKYAASLPELKTDNKLPSLHEMLEENEREDIGNDDLYESDRCRSSRNSGNTNCQQGISCENQPSSDGLSTDIGLTVSRKLSSNNLQQKQQDLLDGTGIANNRQTIFRRTHSVSTFKEQDNNEDYNNSCNNKEKLKENESNLLSNNHRSSCVTSPKTIIILKPVKNTEELKQNDMEKQESRKEQIPKDQGVSLSQQNESQQGRKDQPKQVTSPIKQTSSSLSQQWQKLSQSQNTNSNNIKPFQQVQQNLPQSTNGQSNLSISKIDSNYCVVNPALKAKLIAKGLPEFSSKCWAVMHSDTGEVLIGKNYTYTVEIASLTKIMTCWTTVKFLEENNIDLDTLFLEVSKAATKTIGTSAGLEKGDFLTVKELLYGLMLPSGNDAAITLSEGIGALLLQKQKQMKLSISHQKEQQSQQSELQQHEIKDVIQSGSFIDKNMKQQQGGLNTCMNAFIKEMNRISYVEGLEKSRFSCVHGLPNKNNLSTAKDVGILSRIVMCHPLIRTIVNTQDYCTKFALDANKQATGQYEWENTNLMLDETGYDGVKTGITDTAGPCLSSSYKCVRNGQNVRLICVLLNCKSMDHRWTETKQLIAFTLKHLFPKKAVSSNSP